MAAGLLLGGCANAASDEPIASEAPAPTPSATPSAAPTDEATTDPMMATATSALEVCESLLPAVLGEPETGPVHAPEAIRDEIAAWGPAPSDFMATSYADDRCLLEGESDVWLNVFVETDADGAHAVGVAEESAYGYELLIGEDFDAMGVNGTDGAADNAAGIADAVDVHLADGGCFGEGGVDLDDDGAPDWASHPLADVTVVTVTCDLTPRMPVVDFTVWDGFALRAVQVELWDGETLYTDTNGGGLVQVTDGILELFVPGSGGSCGTVQELVFWPDVDALRTALVRECDPAAPDAPFADWPIVYEAGW